AFDADGVFRDRSVAELYTSLTGLDAADNAVLFLALEELAVQNAALPGRIVPGALGESVRAAGGETAVIGNSDLPDAFRRFGTLIAMDTRGTVGLGSVGRVTLAEDPLWPFGWRTDYDAVWERFAAVAPEARLIVIELGDLARLDAHGPLLAPARRRELEQLTIQRMDA